MNGDVGAAFREILAGSTPSFTPEQRLRAIVRAYDERPKDSRIPTALELLIEAAREHCGFGTQQAFKQDAS